MGTRMIIKITHKTEALQGGRQGPDGGENTVWSMACRFGETKGLLELGLQMEKAGQIGGSGQRERGLKVGAWRSYSYWE